MQKLVQIIYISRSTFENTDTINKIEPNVIRILAKSRISNRKHGLVGVLYFGDGIFMQCLEGDEVAINGLFAKIEHDPRHKDIQLISKKYITKLSFPDWSMKYAPLDEKISRFLKAHDYQHFDPYAFSLETTHKFLNLLMDVHDPTMETKPNTPASYAVLSLKHFRNPNTLSLSFSIVACALSIAALLSVRGVI